MILIKKEKDRKFYDSSKKKYVTLKDLAKYVIQGIEIKVINYKNQEITKEVLMKVYALEPKIMQKQMEKSQSQTLEFTKRYAQQIILMNSMKRISLAWKENNFELIDCEFNVCMEMINQIRDFPRVN